LTANVAERCFLTGVNLPTGVTLTKVWVWHKSNVGGMRVQFIGQALATGAQVVVASATIANATGTRKAFNLPLAAGQVIKNGTMAYGLSVCVSPGDFFYAARIDYTYNSAGD
jgi:hypothetical protein